MPAFFAVLTSSTRKIRTVSERGRTDGGLDLSHLRDLRPPASKCCLNSCHCAQASAQGRNRSAWLSDTVHVCIDPEPDGGHSLIGTKRPSPSWRWRTAGTRAQSYPIF